VLPEKISEFQKFLRVSGKASELGKNEAGELPRWECNVNRESSSDGTVTSGCFE